MESVSRNCFIELAIDLCRDWKKLGYVLGLSNEVERINQDYPQNVSEQAYRLLLAWKQKNGSKATYDVLGDALRKQLVSRVDLAEKYCEGGHQDTLKTDTHLPEHCGKVTDSDIINIASDLGGKWIWVGRLLGLDDTALDGIKEDHDRQYDCSYEMLSLWTRKNSTQATYSWLAQALRHRAVSLVDVVEKYCLEHQRSTVSCIPPEEKMNLVTEKMGQLQVRLPSEKCTSSSVNSPSSTESNSETGLTHPPQVPDDCVRKKFITILPYEIQRILKVKLDPLSDLGGDFRDLACKMGYDVETIRYFQSRQNPTESLLKDCSTKSSVEKLCNKLDAIGQYDARLEIDKWVKSQNCKCTLCFN